MIKNPDCISSGAPSLVSAGRPAGESPRISILQDLEANRGAGTTTRRRMLLPWLLLAAIAGGAAAWGVAGRVAPGTDAIIPPVAEASAAQPPAGDPTPSVPSVAVEADGSGPAVILTRTGAAAASPENLLVGPPGVSDEPAPAAIAPVAMSRPDHPVSAVRSPPDRKAKPKSLLQRKSPNSRTTKRSATDATSLAIQKAVERDVDIITAIVKDVPKR